MTTGLNGSRLLIVDDDEDFGDSLAEALEMHGHKVRSPLLPSRTRGFVSGTPPRRVGEQGC